MLATSIVRLLIKIHLILAVEVYNVCIKNNKTFPMNRTNVKGVDSMLFPRTKCTKVSRHSNTQNSLASIIVIVGDKDFDRFHHLSCTRLCTGTRIWYVSLIVPRRTSVQVVISPGD